MSDFRLSDHMDTRVVILDDEHRYTIAPLTRTRQKAIEKIEQLETDDADSVVAQSIQLIDAHLTSMNGGRSAGEYLSEAWEQDRVSVEQLTALAAYVQEDPDPPALAPSDSTTSPGATST